MSGRDPYIISRLNFRKVVVVTVISALLVILILLSFLMQDGLSISFRNLVMLHGEHPSLFLVDLIPVFIFILLHPMHRIMNRAIRDYEERVKESRQLVARNTEFAKELSEGDNPEPYDEMMETDLGKALRMIQLNIKSNRRKEREQSWIAEGKDIVSKILREHQDLDELSYQILNALNSYIQATQAAFYLFDEEAKTLTNTATYAYNRRKFISQKFQIGEGLVGQCAYEKDYIYRTEIPEDYVTITSGIMGDQKPGSILLVPLISHDDLQGIVEFAFLGDRIPKLTIQFLLELGEIIARTLLNLKMNLRTKRLLEESTKMTDELQNNEVQLQENAREMKNSQGKLETANILLEGKIDEARNAQNRIHLLLEYASEIISIYDNEFGLTYISPSVINIFGYTVEEMMAGKDLERIGRDEATQLRKTLEWLRENPGQVQNLEYSFIKKNGERIFLRTHFRNMLADSAIKGFVLNTTDITESKRMEKEQRLKTRMQSLSENSLDLILRISSSGDIYYANPVVEDYTDISPHTMVNRNLSEIPFKKIFADLLQEILSSMADTPVKKNLLISLPLQMGEHKTERILNVDVIPEFQDNELETILIVGHDITEAKHIEKEIKVQNRKVQDSINYAERIQSSILPETSRIRKAFPKSLVYYKPRDVISGDFPWLFETDDAWYIAAVDCTGHGVPGALLSFIGLFLMNNITGLNPRISAGDLCESLHQEVRKTLKQDREKPETRDGMDMALCRFLKKKLVMEFAGAHRPLYLLSEGEITVYKGDRKAIGGLKHPKKPEQPFTNHEIHYHPGDKFFFFTDGLTDQLGGPDGLKYGSGRVRQLLLENAAYTIPQFYDFFRNDFTGWMGKERQLDDLLLIGIEV
ncbi:MAG: PAS domain S-box protein [Bacteroidales bacterium]|nr:PAS domain S-box protein [Bacteroidales bacterium]